MTKREKAMAALERFRHKYFNEGIVDVGVLEFGMGPEDELVKELEMMALDTEHPEPDACALLWAYYWWEEREDTAWEWWDRGLEMESHLMEAIDLDNREQEVGEDDWTGNEDDVKEDGNGDDEEDDENDNEDEQEFQAYDDETEAGG